MIGLKYINLKGKKYQLAESMMVFIPELKDLPMIKHLPFIKMNKGWLMVMAGYMWDGATGVPANPDNMRASLFHDALYELMQLGLLDRKYRDVADQLLRKICLEDGMEKAWADVFYGVVHALGESHTFPQKQSNGVIEI
ncbi:MAG TPA: hypothetical protein PLP05_00400 [Sedimentisphaerales bacterium]|nr:hypothetical protein [Sedimentisphaerales bacterium]